MPASPGQHWANARFEPILIWAAVGRSSAPDDRATIRAVSDVYDAQTTLDLSRFIKTPAKPFVSVAYEELLARKEVDAVLIATPDHLHVDIAKGALSAGKHIHLETPTLHHWSERKTYNELYSGATVVESSDIGHSKLSDSRQLHASGLVEGEKMVSPAGK